MHDKWMIPCLYLDQGRAVTGRGQKELFQDGDVKRLSAAYSDGGADGLLLFDLSGTDLEHEAAIGTIKEICQAAQIPVTAAGNVKRVEDVKKFLYAGCQRVVLDLAKDSNVGMLKEVSERFGKEKIGVSVSDVKEFEPHQQLVGQYAGLVLAAENVYEKIRGASDVPVLLYMERDSRQGALELLQEEQVRGISGVYVSRGDLPLMEFKMECKERGIAVNTFESAVAWSDFKLNGDGLIPVVVQDCQTDEVLMLAYMNEEAFDYTVKTGRMTYYSRSRETLWVKGETSGHYQYVKSLTIDCDNDTLLAKVEQIGPACHTGSPTCFFKHLAGTDFDESNPLQVFEKVYQTILDRKAYPKEGSYTNYLFDKGLDKILKKIGEEATELVIAAKNPNPEEVKYEMSDFLYHAMVLMVERDISWEDIIKELADR